MTQGISYALFMLVFYTIKDSLIQESPPLITLPLTVALKGAFRQDTKGQALGDN